ncbi:ankyrin repeat domain-containing protein [Streptomyces noursei]|uniref:ankyrin repeat domain-containing protein n=1 Tax=Streptomyces noursei TaxID=1971 RepID=UPI0037B29029
MTTTPTREEFITAVRDGDTERLSQLLLLGADPNVRDTASGLTALMTAAGRGNAPAVRRLLAAGADVYTADSRGGGTALHKAVQGSDPETVQLLLDAGAFVDAVAATTGHTPLMDALWYKWPDVVAVLLDHGAGRNLSTHYGFPMREHFAYELNVNTRGKQRLLAAEQLLKDRTQRDAHAASAQRLMGAVVAGDLDAVRRQLADGAEVDARFPVVNGFNHAHTPLLVACREGHEKIARELIAAGADLNATEPTFGAVPLHKAVYNGHAGITALLVKEPGTDLDFQGITNGYPPLHDALWHSYEECARVLIDATDPEAQELLTQHPTDELPLVVFPDGTVLPAPENAALAARLGLSTTASCPHYDLAIVGAGPAGLAAGVYAASECLTTLLLDADSPGGQAGTSSLIENYLGFPAGLSGGDLARRAVSQAGCFGAELLHPVEVVRLRSAEPARILTLADGSEISAETVLLSTGVTYNRLDVPGADRFEGEGLHYGAATTESSSRVSHHVFIIGGANSAGQAAIHFARYAARVSLLVRAESLESGMSRYLVYEIRRTPNIDIRLNTHVLARDGDDRLERITLRHALTGTKTVETAHFVFTFIGAHPRTGWLGDVVRCDDHGFVLTGPGLSRPAAVSSPTAWPLDRAPLLLETSLPGVFAAGDVRAQSIKRVASGVGEGAMAVALVHRYRAANGAQPQPHRH